MSRVLSCLALLVSSITVAAPIPKGAGTNIVYFPTNVGAKWVYESSNGREEAVVVSAVEKDGDDLIVSREGVDGTTTVYAKMIVSVDGLRQERERADGKVGWVLRAKLMPGDWWDVPDGGKRTVRGMEEIEVPAGKFKALRVDWERNDGTLTSWYAPGIGEVKRVEKVDGVETILRSLKSFKLKDEKK